MKRTITLLAAAAMAVTVLVLPASASDSETSTYKVTITNIAGGESQIMTPFVVATHGKQFDLFRKGHPASNGIQQVAENGGVPILVAELEAAGAVADVGVAGAAPVAPGDSVSVMVEAPSWATRVSLAGMLICTNDGFGGINDAPLPRHGERTYFGKAYDAGTEINTEAYADLVPPCDGLGQTGASNPALAEDGVVRNHRGIEGVADLNGDDHGWRGPVLKVTVERVYGG